MCLGDGRVGLVCVVFWLIVWDVGVVNKRVVSGVICSGCGMKSEVFHTWYWYL